MNTREFALVAFTVLGQMAAGGLLVLLIVRAFAALRGKAAEADRLTDGLLFAIVPIMGLALLASLMHLHNLVNIVKAVPNLGSSWLSREVILSVVFIVVAALYTLLQWRKIAGGALREIVGWIAAIIGMVGVFAMSQVYMIRTEPAWDTPATPLSFFVTSLLLGGLLVAVGLAIRHASLRSTEPQAADLARQALQGIGIGSIVLLGIEFLVLPIYMAFLSTQGVAANQSLHLMISTYGGMLALRLALVFLGGGVLAAILYRSAAQADKEMAFTAVALSAFVLVLAAEVVGRVIFYATRVRLGL